MDPHARDMSPATSPEVLLPNAGVRRVNHLPVVLLVVICAAFVLIVARVAAQRAQKASAPATTQTQHPRSSRKIAEEIVGGRGRGMVQAAAPISRPETPVPTSILPPQAAASARIRRQQEVALSPPLRRRLGTAAPSRAGSDGLAQASESEEARLMRARRREAYLEALGAKMTVDTQNPGGRGAGGDDVSDDATSRLAAARRRLQALRADSSAEAFQAKLAHARGDFGREGASGLPAGKAGQDDGYSRFGKQGEQDRWRLGSRAEAPSTPYLLRAGFVVPATLISGINSELPGQITAQVSRPVYDSPTGKWLLVPQGAQLVGSYATDVIYGQNRVLVAWQRINFPDGRAMDIGAMPGSDEAGYTGFGDKVNNHYVRLFGSALLMSGVTAGVTLSQAESGANGSMAAPTAGSVLSAALGQQLGQATAQLLMKNMNVAPTLEVRPGYSFHVVVTKDLEFDKPYRDFDH